MIDNTHVKRSSSHGKGLLDFCDPLAACRRALSQVQQVTLSDDPRTVRPHASASDITSACGLDDLSTSLAAESTSRTWNIGLHMLTAVAKQRREGWKEAMPRVAQRARHVQERTGTTPSAHELGLDRLPSLGSTPEGPGSLVPAPSPVRDGDTVV